MRFIYVGLLCKKRLTLISPEACPAEKKCLRSAAKFYKLKGDICLTWYQTRQTTYTNVNYLLPDVSLFLPYAFPNDRPIALGYRLFSLRLLSCKLAFFLYIISD